MSRNIDLSDLPQAMQKQARKQLELPPSIFDADPGEPTKGEVKREKELQSLCELELKRRDIRCLHLSFRARELAGWPDLTFCLKGRPMAVELKSRSGRLSEEQIDVLGGMAKDGWETYVLRDPAIFISLLNGDPIMRWGIHNEQKPG